MTTKVLPANLIDARHHAPRPNTIWPAHIVRRDEIAVALDRLAEGPVGEDGRREVLAAHPSSSEPGLGLAPSVAVSFGLLLPGERTRPRRRNASSFTMVLTGTGAVHVDGRSFALAPRDSWNTPGMRLETLENTGDQPLTYVTYSNEPLLRKLEVLYTEYDLPEQEAAEMANAVAAEHSAKIARAKEIAGDAIPVGDTGAAILPYEHLIDPDFVESRALHWRWHDVAPHLGLVRALKQGYTGRPLWCLYNPATGTRNGTTFSFFATITSAAPDMVGPAHRHVSSAINLILEGSGYSIVDGHRLDWEAGDIMLSAPGWSPHGHATGPDGAVIVTVQDHPLHIGTESLIWQENLKGGPILTLGAQQGFETNLAAMRSATA